MIRSLFISWGVHALIFIFLLILSILRPPTPPVKSIMNVRLVPQARAAPPPLGTKTAATPGPVVQPIRTPASAPGITPAPAPKELAKATPKPEPKKTDEPKKVIQRKADIVEPTPKPTPEPEAAATPAPGPTPKATPYRPPTATPAGPTPAPGATGPVAPPKGVTPPVVPAGLVGPSTSPTGAVTADVSMMALGDAYNSIALFMIQQNFKPPRTGPGVTCVVQFRIMRDGEIKNIKIYRSTGHADLDQSAQRALQETVRLPELYEFFKSDFIDVRVTFDFQKE